LLSLPSKWLEWCPPPKRHVHQEAATINLFGKSILSDVIKLGIPRLGHSGLFGLALDPIKCSLMRDRREDMDVWRRSHGNGRHGLEWCSHKSRNSWSHQKMEEQRRIFP
jgi:hypothetical protein